MTNEKMEALLEKRYKLKQDLRQFESSNQCIYTVHYGTTTFETIKYSEEYLKLIEGYIELEIEKIDVVLFSDKKEE